MSRLLSGIFGSLPANVGSSMILDIFFLHQRGKAFACYSLSTALGSLAAPTFGGFILTTRSWTVLFWWTVPLLGITALLVILFLEETKHGTVNGTEYKEEQKGSPRYLYSRIITFLPGSAVSPSISANQFVGISLHWSILLSTNANYSVETHSSPRAHRPFTSSRTGRSVHHDLLRLGSTAQYHFASTSRETS